MQGIGTIAGVILPALYTRCTVLEEVGAYTLDGDEIRNLLVDSPDGYIRVDLNLICPTAVIQMFLDLITWT